MSFLPTTDYDELDDESKGAADRARELNGGALSAPEAALIAHLPSFHASTQWAVLKDELIPLIGERAATLFAFAICDENRSLTYAAELRRTLTQSGEDLERPQVTEAEQLLMDFGRQIVLEPSAVPEEMYERVEASFSPRLRLILVAFAGQLLAADLVATVGRVPLDEELYPFRAPGDARTR